MCAFVSCEYSRLSQPLAASLSPRNVLRAGNEKGQTSAYEKGRKPDIRNETIRGATELFEGSLYVC